MLGELDKTVQVYLQAVSSCGAAINTNITNAKAKALIQRYPDIIGNTDIDMSSFEGRLFKRMSFTHSWRCQERNRTSVLLRNCSNGCKAKYHVLC